MFFIKSIEKNMIKILAIDDTNDNLISLKALITDAFPDSYIITALNGKTGIELALENDPDVILLDIVMPIMDGFEVCRQFKNNTQLRDIPIVFLTSLKDKINRIKALEIGVQGFLSKPIDETELIAQIKAMVKMRAANRLQREEKEKLSKLVASCTRELEQSQIAKNQLLDDLNIENTTRKKTEELLNKTEESYQNLFEANPHPLWVYQRETLRFLAVNATAINHYGFSNQEFLGMSIVDIHPQEDIPTLLDQLQNVESDLHEMGVWRHYKKNGEIIWVEITVHKIDWCQQKAVVVLAHDVTERKMAEEELKTALQQLEFHENNSPLAVIEFNNKFQVTKWSENAKSIFGWEAEEVLGNKIDELLWVHDDDAQRIADLWADMFASKKTSNCYTNRNYRKDGAVITCEWYNSALVDFNNKLISMHSLVMDITEREKAEKSLLDSNTLNQSLLQAIPFGMHIVDETGDILFVNEIMKRQIGTVAIGKKCWELYRDNGTRCLNCPLPSGITVGKTSVSESYNIFGGRVSQISHSSMLFKGQKAMLEIFQDITERKHIETELIFAKEMAEESDQLKTSFLANMSHEIRTPLNSIIGFSEMLTDPDYDSTQQFHIARMIYLSGNKLLSIINNILEISRIEAGQVKVEKNLFVVNNLIKEIEKECLFKSIEKGLDLILDPENPKEEIHLLSDKGKIKQILLNFVSNAIKFTRQGTITIGFQLINNSVEFSVKDTGIGIAREFHEKIFEHFRQVEDANTRKYGGNGLGLSISKGLVNILGGDIWMQSEKGKGSTFCFSIPV